MMTISSNIMQIIDSIRDGTNKIFLPAGTYPVLCAYSIFCQKIKKIAFCNKYSWFLAN